VVLYLDLDKFNLINESCGHAAGDALLHQTATLLRGVVRKHDVVARVGGDEFAIVLEHCSAKQAEGIAGTLIDALGAQRFRWDDKSFAGSVSIGLLALVSADVTVAGAMNAAAAACAAAKAHGGGRVYQFDADDAELTSYRQQVDSVAVIQRALDCDRFELHAQPIRALRAREVEPARRLEILLRMRDEHGTMISPALFLPAAERFGLAQRLDRWVIEHTCAWFALRPEAMDAIDSCAINLSGQSLTDPALAEFISSTFARHLLEPTKFCFEITETAAIACIAQARQLIESLRRRGFRFALDDFGSGLSSFGYLKALPVDVLKIDGVFIRHIATDPLDEAMVRAIAEVAHIMDKTTIAEFVESEAQVATLSRLGIDSLQGYLIGQPQPLANVIEALVGRRARTLRLVG
jgi:diguanylate cyclase (GGDEF)-like protein